MAVFYWFIPLFVLVTALAVLPVLYGSVKNHRWEHHHHAQAQAARAAQQAQTARQATDGPTRVPVAVEAASDHTLSAEDSAEWLALRSQLEDTRREADAIVDRLDHLQRQVSRRKSMARS
jgi:hypothetical protein